MARGCSRSRSAAARWDGRGAAVGPRCAYHAPRGLEPHVGDVVRLGGHPAAEVRHVVRVPRVLPTLESGAEIVERLRGVAGADLCEGWG